QHPQQEIERIREFCDLKPLRAWENNCGRLHELNPKFFRSGTVDSATALSDEHEQMFFELHGDWMAKLGYGCNRAASAPILPAATRRIISEKGKEVFLHSQRLVKLQRKLEESCAAAEESAAQLQAARGENSALKDRLFEIERGLEE